MPPEPLYLFDDDEKSKKNDRKEKELKVHPDTSSTLRKNTEQRIQKRIVLNNDDEPEHGSSKNKIKNDDDEGAERNKETEENGATRDGNEDSSDLEKKFELYLKKNSHFLFNEAQSRVQEFVARRLRKFEKMHDKSLAVEVYKTDDVEIFVEEMVHLLGFNSEEKLIDIGNEKESDESDEREQDEASDDIVDGKDGLCTELEVFQFDEDTDQSTETTSDSPTKNKDLEKDSLDRAEKNKRKRDAKKERKKQEKEKQKLENAAKVEGKAMNPFQHNAYIDFRPRLITYIESKEDTPFVESIAKAREFANRRFRKYKKDGSDPIALDFYRSFQTRDYAMETIHLIGFLSDEQGKSSFAHAEKELINVLIEDRNSKAQRPPDEPGPSGEPNL